MTFTPKCHTMKWKMTLVYVKLGLHSPTLHLTYELQYEFNYYSSHPYVILVGGGGRVKPQLCRKVL